MINKTFDIIELIADNKRYYPNSMKREWWMGDNWVQTKDINIPLGQSRYGGCVIDLPDGIKIPDDMRFAGQLDLAIVSQFDVSNRLPKTGQLLFFANIIEGTGKVIYCDVPNNQLKRITACHDDNFFSGVLIKEFETSQEKLVDYYKSLDEGELECWGCDENILTCECQSEEKQNHIISLELNDEGKSWGYFEGYEKSKFFGVYANCQSTANERLKIMDDYIVLFQIGENGFNDEGVFNVLITEEDLNNHNFDNCELEWVQS